MRYPDLIVPIWTMGSITEKQERGLIGAVEGGVRLAGWHGGRADTFRESINYQFMVGGQRVATPATSSTTRSTSWQRRGNVVATSWTTRAL
jgi:type 1 glutamine amidotransferase